MITYQRKTENNFLMNKCKFWHLVVSASRHIILLKGILVHLNDLYFEVSILSLENSELIFEGHSGVASMLRISMN